MKSNEVIKKIMKFRGHTNQTLATKLGKSTASAVSNKLSRPNGMRIDMFLEMIEAMDCELVVRSKLKDNEKWVINDNSPIEKLDLDKLLEDDEPESNPIIKLTCVPLGGNSGN